MTYQRAYGVLTVLPSLCPLESQGKPEKADPLYKQVLNILRAAVGEEHPHYAITLENQAIFMRDQVRITSVGERSSFTRLPVIL